VDDETKAIGWLPAVVVWIEHYHYQLLTSARRIRLEGGEAKVREKVSVSMWEGLAKSGKERLASMRLMSTPIR